MRRLALVLVAGLAAGCGEDPVEPTPIPGPTTFAYSSQIGVGGSATRTVVLERTGEVKLLLAFLSPDDTASVTLTLGTLDGTACVPIVSVQTPTGTEPQITRGLVAGSYCVSVLDHGALTRVNTFQVNVTIP